MARQVDKFKAAVAGDKDQKIADSGGLYLFVTKKGHRSWRMKYRFGGAEKRLLLGPYPEVSLTRARELRDDAKRLLRDNRDPAIEERKRKIEAVAAAGNTFKRFAVRWHEAQKPRWSPVHIKKVEQALERDVYPQIGSLPLTEIDAPTVLAMLRRVEKRGAIDTAKRIRQHVSAVFEFAIAEGKASADPAGGVKKALLPTPKGGRQPAVRTFAEARDMLAALDQTSANPSTKFASRLIALTAARPGMVQRATWSEIRGVDWDDRSQTVVDARWYVSAERMKLEQEDKDEDAFDHEIPLTWQAIDLLRQQRRLTGTFDFIFVSRLSPRSPMSNNTLGYMYARNGYSGRHVPHGWRSTFSTVMNELAVKARRSEDRAIIDGMLAHKPKGVSASEMAYNRALHWDRRRELAQEWADLITAGLVPASELMKARAT